MKAIVIKRLNRRIGSPSVNASKLPPLEVGTSVEIATTVKGDMVDGNDIWYKTTDGYYVWSGGVELNQENPSIEVIEKVNLYESPDLATINYNKLIKYIPDEWRSTSGKGINIAILDTGCYSHDSLKGAIVAKYNAITENDEIDDVSDSSHGTFIAGLIAARNNIKLIGIAPYVNLIVIKVSLNDFGVDSNNVLKGLNWLSSECPIKPDIINISLDFDPYPNEDKFKQLFYQFYTNSILIFAAAQNNSSLLTDNIFYPAKDISVYGVGALNSDSPILIGGSYKQINRSIKFIVPNITFYSTIKLNQFSTNYGCSFSTAIASGIASLALSSLTNRSISYMDILDQNILEINPNLFQKDLYIFKNSNYEKISN